MECPRCALINLPSAQRCDCGCQRFLIPADAPFVQAAKAQPLTDWRQNRRPTDNLIESTRGPEMASL